jgi:uncharacterized protein
MCSYIIVTTEIAMADWAWDENKSRSNLAKHGIDFSLAELIFRDALSASRLDRNSLEEERWQTIGQVGNIVLFVVHTAPDGLRPGRMISARPASRQERKAYEQGDF